MLLQLTTTHRPATDLGFLLHKNPARAQSFDLAFGKAHVFYPEATEERCTAALLLEVDPVDLVRRRGGPEGEGALLKQYVNDRPYVASSFLSVAIARVFGSALKGESKDRQELAKTTIPLEARIAVLPCRGGEEILRRLFEPLGYVLTAEAVPLEPRFPSWGPSRYFHVTLEADLRLSELLAHLYVLVPVLDAEKHYWIGEDEVVYGPEYTNPENLERLRQRGLSTKRSFALREFALGIESLERFVREEPLRRVHECVFGVLALESEPVDPRL